MHSDNAIGRRLVREKGFRIEPARTTRSFVLCYGGKMGRMTQHVGALFSPPLMWFEGRGVVSIPI
ncbi:hypothetical protein D3C72_919400 [compost metagenome]